MIVDSDRNEIPRRRRRRSFEELAQASRDAAEKALKKYEQKHARAQRHEALAKNRARKLDTRRKIIAGALALEHAKGDPVFREQLYKLLDRYVDGESERQLFGLSPLAPSK